MLQSRNRLIDGLSGVHHHLKPHVVEVVLPPGQKVYDLDQEIDCVFLVNSGIAALIWPDATAAIDLALVGREGMLGTGVSIAGPKALFPVAARTSLSLIRIPAQVFAEAVTRSPALKARLLDFMSALLRQVAETARANARLSVEQRLARWLAIASERLEQSTITATHDDLAFALGCRRAGVTLALHCLEGEKLIRSTRGKVKILDARGLSSFAASQSPPAPLS